MNKASLIINQDEYELISDYKEEAVYRQGLNRLAAKTFGFDFEDWYRQGYWSDKYRPYSLLHHNVVVANVSANPIDFLMEGKLHHIVQIGTVMTEEAFRHKGLSKELIKFVIREYENQCDLIYLYANDSVLDFYPKFGFARADEYFYLKSVKRNKTNLKLRKLNLKEQGDKTLINRLVFGALPVSRYSMTDNPGLVMFYLSSFMADDIYYIDDLDLAVVMQEGEELKLLDIFSEKEFDLDEVIHSLVNEEETTVTLGFTPVDTGSYQCRLLHEEGTTFFIKGEQPFDKGRFPILSHA
jgi:GNAT superfamily N-acetyltransferase